MPSLSLDKRGRLKVSERQVQKACVELLRAHGWLVFETHTDARKSMGEAGQPDLVALKLGRALLLELKRRDGRVSKTQRLWHQEAERLGFTVVVVRDPRELEAEL